MKEELIMIKVLPLILCLTVLLFSSAARAQNLAPEELDRAVSYLEHTRAGVLEATKGLSDAQWNFKQAPDRWSVAEVTEHIAAAEDLLMGLIQSQVMTSPARTEPEDLKALDEVVLQRIGDRSQKAQAPEPLRPNNRYGSPDKSLKHFEESRAKTIAFLKRTRDLRQHAYSLPSLTWLNGKKLDAYEWLLYIAAHSERHTKQINEVKADPHFPKN
jgi:hypothetical protein